MDKKACNWCLHADVDLHMGRPELTCDLVEALKSGKYRTHPAMKGVAYPTEVLQVVRDCWDEENEEGNCPFFQLMQDDFDFFCNHCKGTGLGGGHVDSKLSCPLCRGSGVDIVIKREDYPWM